MKQLQKTIFPLILALILVLSTGMTVLATGEGNIDGGGGGMGSGTKTDVWHSQDGVRVTVVTTSGSVVSTPFDLTNSSIPNATINFGHVCKLQYTSGASLSPGGSRHGNHEQKENQTGGGTSLSGAEHRAGMHDLK